METTKQTGTTLAILAPYLAHGIEVRYADGTEVPRWSTVVAIDAESRRLSRGHHLAWEEISKFLPCLRSFEDLVVPLPDGTVPAVEAFKALLPDEDIDWQAVGVDIREFAPFTRPGEKWITLFAPIQGDKKAGFSISLYNNWKVATFGEPTWERLYLNELIKQHAAVGLLPHQYVRLTSTPSG